MLDEDVRRCPKCGALLFSDMDMCFECLHSIDLDDGWMEESVPLEAYVEGSCEHESTCSNRWSLRMETDSVGATLCVPDVGLVFGRGQSCDVVLHARSVSRRHIRIDPKGEDLLVRDLGARNAALVNGEKVRESGVMHNGDVLDVCGATFVAQLG